MAAKPGFHLAVLARAAAGALALSAFAAPAAAQAPGIVTMMVGSSAGGTYDVTARVIARHIGRYLSGTPQIIVQNVPAAGGLVALNQLFNASPKDGSMMAVVDGALLFEAMFENPAVKFDARQFAWIGSRAKDTPLCVSWTGRGAQTFAEAGQRETIVGAIGGARTDKAPRMLNALLGTKFKIVTGYPGTSELILSLERGEIDGMCGWSWTTIKRRVPEWLAAKKINLLVQTALEKAADLPDTPLALDLVAGEEKRDAMRVLISDTQIAAPIVAPPGMPAAKIAALRNAFDSTMKDAQFLADANQQQIDIDPTSGATIQASVDKLFSLPPATIAAAKAIFKE